MAFQSERHWTPDLRSLRSLVRGDDRVAFAPAKAGAQCRCPYFASAKCERPASFQRRPLALPSLPQRREPSASVAYGARVASTLRRTTESAADVE
jgi:hypothetical protein